MAQNCLKQQVDEHHSKHSFVECDQVFICLQPYNKTSLKVRCHKKLAPKFYDPYYIVQLIVQVAYK